MNLMSPRGLWNVGMQLLTPELEYRLKVRSRGECPFSGACISRKCDNAICTEYKSNM